MKHLCCNKIIILILILISSLYGSLRDKSAIIYYGKNISYTLVGIHNYIIVEPTNIVTYKHGFSVYKNKIYAYVSIGEVDTSSSEYKMINKKWIIGDDKAWHSKILNITNKNYQKFLFTKIIQPQIKRGFKNFFFDTLDSYQSVDKTIKAEKKSQDALANFINKFHKRYPMSKLIVNRGFNIIDKIHSSINAVLFESYYRGFNSKKYTIVSKKNRLWLDEYINKIKSYHLPIIDVEYLPQNKINLAKKLVKKVETKGMIPYVTNSNLDNYGISSENAIKRKILVLIDQNMEYRFNSGAHRDGAMPLEYLGYIQKLHDINHGLPKLSTLNQYAGVIVWLKNSYKHPRKFIHWLLRVKKMGIKIVFASNFGFATTNIFLKPFNIKVVQGSQSYTNRYKITYQSKMVGFEMPPSLDTSSLYLQPSHATALLTYKDKQSLSTTPVAITTWGGYAIGDSFITDINLQDIWIVNPFKFFAQALRLKPLLIPDVTTENGDRLYFSHEDGDGSMNRVEWNPKLFSIYIIYKDILKKYKLPFSISVIGAEIDKNGLYPKESKRLRFIAKEIYALPNVEPATHTFSHPFFWEKIKNGNLSPKYRLAPKGYKFSLKYEILGQIKDINEHLIPLNKKRCHMLFWSGDCRPSVKVLKFVYKHKILNINGGGATATNLNPWLSNVPSLGLDKDGFYQIYTGEENEDIYTNLWNGPFWGLKKVIQTFNLTNSPRRLKPIDVYFHFYSGSKRASLNALKYIYDWVLKQKDIMPIFTSAFIPKVMDFYTVSIANNKNHWLFCGMKSLHTVRIEKQNAFVDFNSSKGVVGITHFQKHTYISLDNNQTQYITTSKKYNPNNPYIINANARLNYFKVNKNKTMFKFQADVTLKIRLFVPDICTLHVYPNGYKLTKKSHNIVFLTYKNIKNADINVTCKQNK